MPTIPENEWSEVDKYIEERHKEDIKVCQKPWKVLKVDEAQGGR
jgi:hypothetical protein